MDNSHRRRGGAAARTVGRSALACQPAASVPVEVRTAAASWASGFELLGTNPDGTATIRSNRTGATRQLPGDQWRCPDEVAALEAIAMEAV